jgi:hypothetical protein
MAVSVSLAQDRPTDDAGATAHRDAPTPLAPLSERIAEVSLTEVPLDQALDWLADFTPLSVVVRWQVLEHAGVPRDTPITLEIRNLRLSQVLWIMLREAGGTDVRLAFRAQPDLLTISTRDDLARDMFLGVYDVNDLLLEVPHVTDRIQIDIARSGTGDSGPWDGGRGSSDPERGEGDQQDKTTRLIELITNTVEPDSWDRNGGLGTISAWGSLLVVRNSASVHQALGKSVAEQD